jgi:predicted O-methyltransferase YrrM
MKIQVDFHRDSMQGQMKPEERKAMYELVVAAKPARMLEIGTWKGGGSTYILGCAALEYGGHLDSIEANKDFHDAAVRLFDERMTILKPHVTFHLGLSHDVIPELLKQGDFDFVLFDGAEDAAQTVREYDLLNHHLPLGCHIACHDWNIDKMRLLRVVLANDNTWQTIVVMPQTDTGFAILRRTV